MPRDPLLAQRAGVDQRRARPHRAQVRVQAEALAQAEQALLGARRVGVGRVPLRAADRAEQDGVGGAAGLEHLVGERDPCASIEAPPTAARRTRTRRARRAGAARRRRSRARSRRRAGARSAVLATAGSRPPARDVQPDVVERQRPRHRSSTASMNASCRSSGSRSEVLARPTVRRNARGSRGLDRLRARASSGPSVEPGPLEAGAVSLDRGEVPGCRACREVGREALVAIGDPTIASPSSARLPFPPHWADQRPPGAARRGAARTGGRGRGSSGRWRSRRPRRPARRARARRGRRRGARPRARATLARLLDHRAQSRRRRSPGPSGRRSARASVTRPLPQPASSTVSSPSQRRAARGPRAPTPPGGRRPGRRLGVPLARSGMRWRVDDIAQSARRDRAAVGAARALERVDRRRVLERHADVVEPVERGGA